MESKKIIKVTRELAEEVSYIYAASWKTAYRGIVPQSYLDGLSQEQWVPFLSDPQRAAFAMDIDGVLAATVSVSPAREKEMEGWGEIISIYVLPKYFRKGCGRELFSYGVTLLQTMGFTNIYLWVLEDNKGAREFYHKNGFYPNGDKQTICIEGKPLTELRYIHTIKQKMPME